MKKAGRELRFSIFNLLLFMTVVVWPAGVLEAKYSGGSGTAGNPYRIGSSADLLALAADTGDYHKCFVLTTDIDLDPDLPGGQVFSTAVIAPDTDGATWSFEGVGFTGIFDGAGYKIINLVIDTAGAGNYYLGLFGSLEGEVKNLGLENVTVTGGSGSEYIGGLAGCNFGDISNCYSTGTVTSGNGLYYLGGLVGYNGGNISNCYSTGTVTGGNGSNYLGGLVGSIQNGDISDCYSTGAVTGGGGSTCLGGLVGGNYYSSISNCYSTGDVNGGDYARYLGGLSGDNYMGSTSNCYATGTVSGGDYSEDLGGLVGWNGSTISNCYSTGAVHGGDESVDIGGLVGKNYSHTVVNCYSTGAVTSGGGSICLGGLVGWNGSTISSSYFLITSGPANGYGEPLTDTQMKQQASFVGWDFVGETANGTEEIWSINEGVDYPWQTGAEEVGGQVTKCTVTAGSKDNSDKISISGQMDANETDFNDANEIQVTIDSNDMVSPCVQTFPINDTTFKKGKYKCTITNKPLKTSFAFDTKSLKFSFTAKNVDLSGLSCPLTVRIEIGDYNTETEVNEAIVNGAKKPIPIKLMMGVKNALRVDSDKVTRGKKKPNTDQLSVKGGFAVEDPGVSMTNRVSEGLVITLGTQQFTIPANKLKVGKDKFTCSKADVAEGGVAAATFNFTTCSFTITIKNITIEAGPGAANFSVEFADFSESVPVVLP